MPKSLSLKSELLNIFDIADINLLMSIKGLTVEQVSTQVFPNTNSILFIFLHCARQLDRYLSKFGVDLVIPGKSVNEVLDKGFTFGQVVEAYLKISGDFRERVKQLDDEKLADPIDKGEKLYKIIQRVSLHYCGHMGQISFIRRIMDDTIEGGYTFIKAMSDPTRKQLRKEWNEWWQNLRNDLV